MLALTAGVVAAGDLSLTGTAANRWGLSVDELLALHRTETERVRMVLLEASVTDRKGRVVRGLDETDFRVHDDDVPQQIAFFSGDEAEPLSVAFLLDVSGSMHNRDKLHRAKRAIRELTERLRPADRMALISFADEGVSWVVDFTHDRDAFVRGLGQQRPYGETALVDALAVAPALVDGSARARKAIVLVTDSDDNSSRTPVAEALELARRVKLPVYTIAFMSVDPDWLTADAVAERLATVELISAATGGRVFAVHGDEDLDRALETLDDELGHQYVIGFYPEATADGRFHEIRLEVEAARLQARTRTGYYATP